MITRWEKNSLLFYKNATENISFTDKEEYLREFYSIENAYEAINTLLFPGVENEKVRVLSEKRVLPTALLDNMSELLNVYCRIYSIMCKYTRNESKKKLYTYRVDRMNTLDYLEQGKTCSFLSTSRNHEISTYYHKKAGLLLLEVEALGTIEHVDVNAVLGEDFKYPEEEEVLFAPFLYLSKIPIVMTEEERTFVDINDEPPKGKYRLKLLVSATEEQRGQMEKTDIDVFANLKEKILLDDEIENAKKVWNNLADGNMAEQKCVEQYIEWKETLHKYLIQEFSQIKENVEKDYNERMYLFREKLNNLFETSNNKRKEYEKRLMSYQRILSILQPLMLFSLL